METAEKTQQREWLSCAETAKILRQALKREFPGTKFSVRSKTYAGGASISVDYSDDLDREHIRRVCDQFAGGRFDGMTDLAYAAEHWLLPDGTAIVRREYGHSYHDAEVHNEDRQPPKGARLVRFGADYIFPQRNGMLA